MDIQNITIFVDGQSERKALEIHFKKYYGKSPKLVLGPGNGTNYSVELYAKRIAGDICVALNSSAHEIVLMPDLERRQSKHNINCSQFGKEIKSAVIKEIISISSFKETYLDSVIHVCPSDIMFENWIICDIDGISKSGLLTKPYEQSNFDGQHGANLIGKMMKPGKYKKTTHACMLFKHVDPTVGVTNSSSFKNFVSTVYSLTQR